MIDGLKFLMNLINLKSQLNMKEVLIGLKRLSGRELIKSSQLENKMSKVFY